MAMSQAAYSAEKAIGHDDNAITHQDLTNPAQQEFGDPSDKMKAIAWMGKNKVELIESPRPKIVEDRDVILKVTGSTVCGSDMHLLHGVITELSKGDILGHEFCGVVDETGPAVTNVKKGDRVVCSFQIACGEVSWSSFIGEERVLIRRSASTANRSCRRCARRRTLVPS